MVAGRLGDVIGFANEVNNSHSILHEDLLRQIRCLPLEDNAISVCYCSDISCLPWRRALLSLCAAAIIFAAHGRIMFVLSGTPIENTMFELHSQFDFA